MTVCDTARTHPMTLVLPVPVRDFFAVLAEFGTVIAVTDRVRGGVTLHLSATDLVEAEHKTRMLGQALGATGLAPAFPTGHYGGSLSYPSYRWEFDVPCYAGEGRWAILVPLTADLDHLFGVVSGLGSWDRDYRGEPVLPVTLYPEDEADLYRLRNEIETELSAWSSEPVTLTTR